MVRVDGSWRFLTLRSVSARLTLVSMAGSPDFFSSQIAEARRFCLDLTPSRRERLVVVCGGCEHCTPDYEIRRSVFPYWVIEFVAQGVGRVTLHDQSYPLVPGTLFAYGPGVSHDIVAAPPERMVKYFVAFTGRDARTLLERYAPAPGEAVQTRAPSDLLALFDALVRTGLLNTPFTPRLTRLMVEQLMVKLAETTMPVGTADSPAFATYSRCKAYIEQHWSDIATLEHAARACGVSTAYLCRLFQRFDHQSPYQFLLRLKMGQAVERLLARDTSVRRVAEELGFSDPFHFSHVFKNVLGVSPGQFARSHRRTYRRPGLTNET